MTTWYLAICTECGRPGRRLPQPFASQDERDTWADTHRAATGHEVVRATDTWKAEPHHPPRRRRW